MSNLRLRDCIIKIDGAFKRAKKLGYTTLGFTDHESISSWIKVEKIAKKYPEIKTIRGNEIYLCRNGLNAQNFNRDKDGYWHFVLLAKDLIGAKQIFKISTRAWMRSYISRGMRRVPTYYQDLFDIIGDNPGHIIASTACLGGLLPTQILRGAPDEKLISWISQLDKLFGHGNFFLEMQPSHNNEQIVVNKKLYEFSNKLQIPYIITTDSHYLKKKDRPIHKAYLNAQNGEREVDDFYATTYMMDTDELESYFPYLEKSDLIKAYRTIEEIGEMCENYSLSKPLKIPELMWRSIESDNYDYGKYFELMPTLKKFYESPHKSDRYLVDAVLDGINRHLDLQNNEGYAALEDNLQRTWESSEVNKARWSAYFLNLQKTIDECWNAGTLVGPSRGSGGGFLLLYCLDIIQMNTLRENTKTFPWRLTRKESKAS